MALAGLVFIAVLYLLFRPHKKSKLPAHRVPSGKPPVVVMTVFDDTNYNREYLEAIRENRVQYAEKHGMRS
jgi:mannan polymerase II complex MNN11 subunit